MNVGPDKKMRKVELSNYQEMPPRSWEAGRVLTPTRRISGGIRVLQQIDYWISQIAKSKHAKESNIDYVTLLGLLGNYPANVFQDCAFGALGGISHKRFSQGRFKGVFRSFKGGSTVIAHPGAGSGWVASAVRTAASVAVPLTFAVLTTERKAA